MSSEKVILSILAGIFLLGVLLRVLFAAFFPKRFADGARDVLFLQDRKKALFRGNKLHSNRNGNGQADPTLPDF